ncbi:cytochrome p450 [Seiridium cupressi]
MMLSIIGTILRGLGLLILVFLGYLGYNLFFHPLRSYPGPWYAKSSILWFVYQSFTGDYPFKVHELHLKYGPIVRIAPNELAYTDPQAWKDIYGHRTGQPENVKDPSQNIDDDQTHPSIVFAGREQHSKLRKLLSNAFSDKAMREQEPVLTSYVDQLVEGLRKQCSEPLDLVQWYNFTTFDIIGHLAFAEPFDCLSNSAYHPWVHMIFSTFKFVTWIRALNRLAPGFSTFLMRMAPKRVLREHAANFQLSREKVLRRKANKPEYVDFLTNLLSAEESGKLTERDIVNNGPTLVVAGSETTATVLSGATFFILKDQSVYRKLKEEVQSSFQSVEEITLNKMGELQYLHAVLDEALRLYPPGANNHPRLTPPQGATICGRFVPGNCMVGINQYAMFRSPLNFADADAFIPERSIDRAGKWIADKRDALQPFSFGPRNCIGRNLAFSEMRLIMCRLLFSFDLELAPGQEDWLNQKVYTSWEKKPLMVKLRPIQE